MSESATKPKIYDLKNNISNIVPPYAVSAFPRTMVGLQLNVLDGCPNIVINQTLCHADGSLHTNKDGILLSAAGFDELLIQLQGLEMILNTKKRLPVNVNDLTYTPPYNIDLASALRDLNQLTKDSKPETM